MSMSTQLTQICYIFCTTDYQKRNIYQQIYQLFCIK